MNTHYGTVKGQMQGEKQRMEQMKVWLQEVGSPMSHVERCDFTDEQDDLPHLFIKVLGSRLPQLQHEELQPGSTGLLFFARPDTPVTFPIMLYRKAFS